MTFKPKPKCARHLLLHRLDYEFNNHDQLGLQQELDTLAAFPTKLLKEAALSPSSILRSGVLSSLPTEPFARWEQILALYLARSRCPDISHKYHNVFIHCRMSH